MKIWEQLKSNDASRQVNTYVTLRLGMYLTEEFNQMIINGYCEIKRGKNQY